MTKLQLLKKCVLTSARLNFEHATITRESLFVYKCATPCGVAYVQILPNGIDEVEVLKTENANQFFLKKLNQLEIVQGQASCAKYLKRLYMELYEL